MTIALCLKAPFLVGEPTQDYLKIQLLVLEFSALEWVDWLTIDDCWNLLAMCRQPAEFEMAE
jgi:hypothetical protein